MSFKTGLKIKANLKKKYHDLFNLRASLFDLHYEENQVKVLSTPSTLLLLTALKRNVKARNTATLTHYQVGSKKGKLFILRAYQNKLPCCIVSN